jgi:hypothetical protein
MAQTFEEWWKQHHERWIKNKRIVAPIDVRQAWDARDAEIAEVKANAEEAALDASTADMLRRINENLSDRLDRAIEREDGRSMALAALQMRIAELERCALSLDAPCIGNDPSCPCNDGDACNYKGENPFPVKANPPSEPNRE